MGLGGAARGIRVTIVAANPFEFDSRFLRTAMTLATEGHDVRILGWPGPGLPAREELAPGVMLTRLDIDRRITSGLRPLPTQVRSALARLIGLDPAAWVLPPDAPRGIDRVRHLGRRLLEVVSNARRVGPWTDAVVVQAAETDVFHAQSLIALPVVRRAAQRLGARFVYDIADYHTEAARLARMPWLVRELVRRRERRWARDASGFLAVSEPVAALVERRFGVERPAVLLNCPPAWRPEESTPPLSDRLRMAAGIELGRPIILYQGGLSVDRGVEELVAASDESSLRALGAAMVFMGYGRLQDFVDRAARERPGRLYVLPAVPVQGLLEWTAGADVSFVGQPPRTLNQRLNLPNKLFESLMAGVPVVVSQGNEQCRLTMSEGVGRCVDIDSPASVAAGIVDLLTASEAERQRLRQHCRTVALTKYTWDLNAAGLRELYERLARAAPRRSGGPPGS